MEMQWTDEKGNEREGVRLGLTFLITASAGSPTVQSCASDRCQHRAPTGLYTQLSEMSTNLLSFPFSFLTVTSASSPLTGLINRRSLGDPASSLASLSASPSSFNVRRSPPTQEQNSNNFFGPVISDAVESDEDRTMKCAYYNRTQCETTNVGCGKEYQICHPNEGNERTSLCYALWRNSTEKGIEIEFKGCWLGHSKDCVPKDSSETHQSDHCVQTQTPMRNKKQLFFCCCTGAKCNKNVKHLPLPAEPVPTPADQRKCPFFLLSLQ